MVGEAVQLPAAGAGPGEGLAEGRGEVREHRRGGLGRGVGEVRRGRGAGDQRLGVLRRARAPCGGLGGPDQRLQVRGGHGGARHDPRGRALLAVDRGDDGQGPAAGDAVGGERVARPAQVGRRLLVGDDDTAVGGGQLQRALDDLVGLRATRRHQRPASCVVFKMFTSRNSADGQPCETAATWPGCALPQLKAPPSTYVCGPPTFSIEPQKSVVVAW